LNIHGVAPSYGFVCLAMIEMRLCVGGVVWF
jgi:hypothetical protein